MKSIEFYRHNLDEADIRSATKVMRSLFLSTGAVVAEFENKFARLFGRNMYARGTTSCTAALHLALDAVGIKRGDEVITTPLSYIATTHAIEYVGARPRFVDVEADTGNLDIQNIESHINKKTRMILPVHLYGQMVDMREVSRIGKKHKISIVEDAAHALESAHNGLRPGAVSDAACFSFYGTKSITSGEGGVLLTRHDSLSKIILRLRHHGVSRSAATRHGKLYQHYDVLDLGWKYNMNNIQAALLIGQISRIQRNWKRRQQIALRYAKEFGAAGIEFPTTRPGVTHSYYLFTVWVNPKRRDEYMHELQRQGVGVAVNFRPIHLMTYYRKKYGFSRGDFPNAERIGSRTISLPLYSKLTDSEVSYIISTVKRVCKT